MDVIIEVLFFLFFYIALPCTCIILLLMLLLYLPRGTKKPEKKPEKKEEDMETLDELCIRLYGKPYEELDKNTQDQALYCYSYCR